MQRSQNCGGMKADVSCQPHCPPCRIPVARRNPLLASQWGQMGLCDVSQRGLDICCPMGLEMLGGGGGVGQVLGSKTLIFEEVVMRGELASAPR